MLKSSRYPQRSSTLHLADHYPSVTILERLFSRSRPRYRYSSGPRSTPSRALRGLVECQAREFGQGCGCRWRTESGDSSGRRDRSTESRIRRDPQGMSLSDSSPRIVGERLNRHFVDSSSPTTLMPISPPTSLTSSRRTSRNSPTFSYGSTKQKVCWSLAYFASLISKSTTTTD